MTYTVVWKPNAKSRLAAVWLASGDRKAVTAAAHRVDLLLKTDPDTRGTINFDTVRTLLVAPLGVEFEVIQDDMLVFVLSVWDASANPAGP